MNENQYNKAVEILIQTMEKLKETATPAHCEAMAKVALALVEVGRLGGAIHTDVRNCATTDHGFVPSDAETEETSGINQRCDR